VLTLSGTYGELLDYVIFGDWIFFGLIAATIFRYRAGDKGEARRLGAAMPGGKYRAPWYPVLPGFFVMACGYVVISSIASNPAIALIGAGLIALGVPVFVWQRRGRGS
jgi:basic amino acid/polyamine antiporter, APA family